MDDRSVALGMALVATSAASVACGIGCSSSTTERSCEQFAPLRTCPAGATVHGIDVSKYQGMVDWAQAKSAGIRFAFARISDGTANPDATFSANWHGMVESGIVRGAYQYFRASVSPSAQATLVVASLDNAGGLGSADLPVVLDLETSDGQTESTIEANVRTWLTAIEGQTGRTPIIYTSTGTYPISMATFAAYPLWVANYGATCPSMPVGWSNWRFWQYSSTGSVNGIQGDVDLDEFDGTLSALTAFGKSAGAAASGPRFTDASALTFDDAAPPAEAGLLAEDGAAQEAPANRGDVAMGSAGNPLAHASMPGPDAQVGSCRP
jgi:lysozyme